MTRRLIVVFALVTTIGLTLLAVPLGLTIAHRERERLLFDIEHDADAISAVAERTLEGEVATVPDVLAHYAQRTGGHVILVDRAGRATFDSEHPTEPGRDYSTRPEIRAALSGRRVEGTRRSETLGTTLLYAAVPATADGRVNGAVRVTYPTATLDERVWKSWARVAILCLGVLIVVVALGAILARGVTRPVRRLEAATDRLAAGDLTARVDEDDGPPELRHLASSFNRMADRLSRLLETQQQFVADASHQLRTPLTALRLRLENLQARVPEAEAQRLDAAAAEVTRLTRLVNGLLLLERGNGPSNERVVDDATSIASERVAAWNEVLAERGITISLAAAAPAPTLVTPGTVEQLIDNLVDNASAVSPPGSAIDVSVDTVDDMVELHVRDHGPGLGAAERELAFDRFWRSPDAEPGGSGLGLAIVRQLAEAVGGTARLAVRPDGPGLDAFVSLPAARRSSAAKV